MAVVSASSGAPLTKQRTLNNIVYNASDQTVYEAGRLNLIIFII
ncbi:MULTISPECIES: DUF1659 domain-containing protein [unclassified Dehalobacter]|uniref:Uncharacterized protein n=1 Tax=Dehalobacter restrictus (strain DSM 9455 / PER-K23) TaxID=871738 RepID=A0ABN4C1V3_DEHRP|nr:MULTISPECIES: DUF1659 domain-containing protein [unclassified Dehalobacter]AHF11492.1 hypothetical protein DEHRE_13885 [Dehalobacter restrictus DSM 9455]MDJ0305163.1 DUF1659 domain-containing protein [Dehalobacter sp.]